MNQLKRYCAVLTAVLLLLLSFNQNATAQTHTPKYNVSMAGSTGGYYEYLPQGYDSNGTTKHPVIIFIHGIYETGNGSSTQLGRILGFGLPRKIKYGAFPTSFTVNGKTEKFIVISPQFKYTPGAADISSIITYVLGKYKANPNKVYLTGLSMGGGVTWNFGSNTLYNKKIAAMVPICGSSSVSSAGAAAIAAAGIGVWATHNQYDDVVPASKTVNWINYILAAKSTAKAKKSIWARSGHDAWTKTYTATYKEDNLNVFEWMLQFDRGGSTPSGGNVAPVSNAGTDRGVTLPTSTATLVGTGTDPDGSITKYAWSKVSGPTGGTISNASAATTTVSALIAGTYTFRLTVTDNSGASASNDVAVYVSNATNPLTNNNGAKINVVNVNLFGGTNPFVNTAWNNWNVSSSLSSGTLKYADATASTITASLSKSSGINDNGSAYGSGMAPAEVLRYTSNATTSRTLTLSGLSATKTYALEIYGSRNNYTGNSTGYTIGSTTKNIATYKNLSNKAVFASLTPNSSGQIVVTIANAQEYNYINGFTLTEVKAVKANIYGGSNPISDASWNNWNVSSSLSSGTLKYADATSSAITASLSKSSGINDNGTSYGSGMAPAAVLRYASNATTSRTLTLSGLSVTKTYSLELFASRGNYSGNLTKFTINGIAQSISTYNNLTSKASFDGLVPSAAGTIVVTIANTHDYNYLNGFVLTEGVGGSTAGVEPTTTVARAASTEETDASLSVSPNPFTDKFALKVTNTLTGAMKVDIIGADGAVKKTFQLNKAAAGTMQTYLSAGDLPVGSYQMQVTMGVWSQSIPVQKN